MNLLAWILAGVMTGVAAYLGWRWQRTEAERRALQDAARNMATGAQQQQERNERLTQLLQALEEVDASSVFLLDESLRIQWMSQAAHRLCHSRLPLPLPLHQALRSYETLALAKSALRDDLTHEHQFSSDDHSFLAAAKRVSQKPILITLVIQDVTERLRKERARRDFFANLSHELRTPIASIRLMIETLQQGAAASAKQRQRLLTSIYEQIDSLQQLAREMLDLSMIESGKMPLKMTETRVEAIAEPVRQRMIAPAERKSITLEASYQPEVQVWADTTYVQRVLQNLLYNAIKFTPEGGHIALSGHAEEDVYVFEVADNGVGIDDKDLPHLFKRFFKADRMRSMEGTGLGLAIAKHIVEGHGGRIWVKSKLGEGATFYFNLPRV